MEVEGPREGEGGREDERATWVLDRDDTTPRAPRVAARSHGWRAMPRAIGGESA